MLLTIFLAIVFCVAITLMMFAAVAFIQNEKFVSSAPKEARAVLRHRDEELFYVIHHRPPRTDFTALSLIIRSSCRSE